MSKRGRCAVSEALAIAAKRGRRGGVVLTSVQSGSLPTPVVPDETEWSMHSELDGGSVHDRLWEMTVDFGKHRGKCLADVSHVEPYLAWVWYLEQPCKQARLIQRCMREAAFTDPEEMPLEWRFEPATRVVSPHTETLIVDLPPVEDRGAVNWGLREWDRLREPVIVEFQPAWTQWELWCAVRNAICSKPVVLRCFSSRWVLKSVFFTREGLHTRVTFA